MALALIFLVAGLVWTAVAFGLYLLLADGGASLVAITRWLDLEPATTQWFADTLALADLPARGLVLIIWSAGLALILWLAWLAASHRS